MGQFFRIQDLGAIAPGLELVIMGMVLRSADLLMKDKKKLGVFAIIGLGLSGVLLFRLTGIETSAYGDVLVVDQFANFFKLIFMLGAALSIALSLKYLDIERENH